MGIGHGLYMLDRELASLGTTRLAHEHPDNNMDAALYAIRLARIGDPTDSLERLDQTCLTLMDYIIEGRRHDRLDLPITMIDRYKGAADYLGRFFPADDPKRDEAFNILKQKLVEHYEDAGSRLKEEQPYIRIRPFERVYDGNIPYDPDGTLHIYIPRDTARKALAWNQQILHTLQDGAHPEETLSILFNPKSHPLTEALKLGDGAWLHVKGVIMCETGQFGGRLRTPVHDKADIPQKMLASPEREYYDQPDWYMTSHVMDKETAKLAVNIHAADDAEVQHLDADAVVDSYEVLVAIMDLNPTIFHSLISESWLWDEQLQTLFPHQPVSTLASVAGEKYALRQAGDPDDIMVRLATAGSKTRRAAYEAGEYTPTVYDRQITRDRMQQFIDERKSQRG